MPTGGQSLGPYDPLLFGANEDSGLVAVECREARRGPDRLSLFFRRNGATALEHEPFSPFILADRAAMEGCPVPFDARPLAGSGRLNLCARFACWRDCLKARDWLAEATAAKPSAPDAPYLFVSDPVQQHLMSTGRTLFKGMAFEDLRRMQVDIECYTTPGYEFCNAEREGDRIIAIALCSGEGEVEALSGAGLSEADLLAAFVARVRERDPDVIEGHNIFNFDLPYVAERAKRCGVKLALGRDGSVPQRRASRFSVGDRTIAYERFDIFGRHVVDTLFLVHAYDVMHRSLDGFGLKDVAVHFGLAAKDRTYIDGSAISAVFRTDPERLARYVRDDALETRGLSDLLSPSCFAQAQVLPYSYQNVCVRGSATKIDALMIREYLRQGRALPLGDAPREFAGGYTDVFLEGVVQDVHHCDVRSLYPSLMLTRGVAPRSDDLGVFLKLLEALRSFRLQAKESMGRSASRAERTYFDALQGAFKVLINSFYGYLGFPQARFSDFEAAERITEMGRTLLAGMIDWLRRHGAQPIEIDTDGIYFLPPPPDAALEGERFRAAFQASLPPGIEVEFDGQFKAMFSYKMKNYALLTEEGELVMKGAALKSRGIEPFQRAFLREMIRLRLEGRAEQIPALKALFEKAIREAEWPIAFFAKTERLQDSPATYAARQAKGKAPKDAAYELALKSGRPYRAGDQVSYYVTGTKKNVPVHENSKLVSAWDPASRDENVAYYVAKLEALYEKFSGQTPQGELAL